MTETEILRKLVAVFPERPAIQYFGRAFVELEGNSPTEFLDLLHSAREALKLDWQPCGASDCHLCTGSDND